MTRDTSKGHLSYEDRAASFEGSHGHTSLGWGAIEAVLGFWKTGCIKTIYQLLMNTNETYLSPVIESNRRKK